MRANDHYSGPNPDACNMYLIMLARYLCELSATEFCVDESAPVSSTLNASSATIVWKSCDFPSSFALVGSDCSVRILTFKFIQNFLSNGDWR